MEKKGEVADGNLTVVNRRPRRGSLAIAKAAMQYQRQQESYRPHQDELRTQSTNRHCKAEENEQKKRWGPGS
eukprot:2026635-Rhodomonas_salina.1